MGGNSWGELFFLGLLVLVSVIIPFSVIAFIWWKLFIKDFVKRFLNSHLVWKIRCLFIERGDTLYREIDEGTEIMKFFEKEVGLMRYQSKEFRQEFMNLIEKHYPTYYYYYQPEAR